MMNKHLLIAVMMIVLSVYVYWNGAAAAAVINDRAVDCVSIGTFGASKSGLGIGEWKNESAADAVDGDIGY